VVVGDVKTPEVMADVRQLFGAIPRGPAPPPVTAVEPPQVDERRVVVRKAGAQLPIVDLAWHVPDYRSPDAPALELLSTILSEGRASRLYKKLVYEQQLALGAGGDYPYFSRDPNLFSFYATPLPGKGAEALEEALLAEIERLRAEPCPGEELERAKNQIEAAFVWQQDSVHSRATSLARFELAGSWRLQSDFVPRVRAVTAADLQRVARAYFPTDRRNVAILLPSGASEPAAK
jgi:zinc protease